MEKSYLTNCLVRMDEKTVVYAVNKISIVREGGRTVGSGSVAAIIK
ncbi:MAG: hypothetical protein PHE06_02025 [Lachnospiraceae bacterium]|nr:hypothetical protein [Lachnospiraceae bacterium]